ncbi:pyridoxamine 5'-phosphate oxidase [Edaphobacter acidisoli]|uniref:Pyridoxamine 5'-phosphate oxidase n=1 Tax=Edaphobacter acidisoli TaxID=2040573 RepID=A0A916S461_9BACT|nr:pyridoxamine 5'-phosphate oxidase family protein [Edaphobacter acidisoli]GGA79940.1 pyridoxamine 5'-phosphate oxidase [Edaphobacter acidisoli]
MGKRFERIEPAHREFILTQRVFFNASAALEGRVNVSPRDVASLRVLDEYRVVYLDLTGSGNETAAHLRVSPRLTLMFCAFTGAPMVLRLYGHGRTIAHHSREYAELLASAFGGSETPGARQMVMLDVEMVQTSCGYNVPFFDYTGERETLRRWAENKGQDGLKQYWREKNTASIDGFPTGILEED